MNRAELVTYSKDMLPVFKITEREAEELRVARMWYRWAMSAPESVRIRHKPFLCLHLSTDLKGAVNKALGSPTTSLEQYLRYYHKVFFISRGRRLTGEGVCVEHYQMRIDWIDRLLGWR